MMNISMSNSTMSSSFPNQFLFPLSHSSKTLDHPYSLHLHFPSMIFFLLFPFIFSFFILYKLKITKQVSAVVLPPPGPTPWPLVGNLPELIMKKPAFRWIHGLMEELNTEIACIKLGNVHVIPVTSPEIAREFLKKHDSVFASRPTTMASDRLSRGFQTTALSPWGDQWKKMRRILTSEILKPARHAWLLPKRTEEADNLLGFVYSQCSKLPADDSSVVNVRNAVRLYTGNVSRKMIFSRRYFGEGREDGGPGFEEEEHVSSIFTSLAYLYAFSPSDYLPWLRVFDFDGHEKIVKRAIRVVNKYHDPVIDERITQWRNEEKKDLDDILDVLITLKDSNGEPLLSVEEIKAQIMVRIFN